MYRKLFVLALIAFAPLPAAAAGVGIGLLPQAVGQRAHLRVVRTVQGTTGPLPATMAFDLVRRTATTLVIERQRPDGTPNLSVLTENKDGSLALTEDARGTAADADVSEVLVGLNLALAATRGADTSTHETWVATIPVGPTTGGPAASVALISSNIAGSEFDFSGDGQATASAPTDRRRNSGSSGGIGGGGSPGGMGGGGGGGFPGGGRGGRSRGGESGGGGGGGAEGAPVSVHVAGHVSNGRIAQVVISQTRSVTIASLPYINVGSWSITVLK
jgi:hypothetical protein